MAEVFRFDTRNLPRLERLNKFRINCDEKPTYLDMVVVSIQPGPLDTAFPMTATAWLGKNARA
jgi:hypothetical protein